MTDLEIAGDFLNQDSPELEVKLLKAAKGPFSAYAPEEMREACQQLIRDKRG